MSQPPGYTPPPGQPGFGEQQQPPQGYGQMPAGSPQGYQGFPPEQKKNKGLIIGLAVGGGVLVIGLVVGLIFWLTSSSASSPEEAVENFQDAIAAKDKDGVKDLLCKEDRDSLGKETGFDFEELDDVEIKNLKVKVTGKEKIDIDGYDEAYSVNYNVTGTLKFNGQTQELDNDDSETVVKEDGDWRVCPSAG